MNDWTMLGTTETGKPMKMAAHGSVACIHGDECWTVIPQTDEL